MGKPGEIRVSVVIPTWNAATFVERVLRSLSAQEGGVSHEILVVDNGVVNNETEKVCAGFPGVRYLRFEKQLGYAGAVNEGTLAARGELVAVTNNDNLPDPRWLAELVRAYDAAKAEGREAIITSLVHRPDFPRPLEARMNLWGRIVRAPRRPGPYVPLHPDGSSFLFSREAFGLPYDAAYFIYHEDVYLGWRAWLTGRVVRLCESSTAETFDGGSTRRIRYRTAFYTERNRWWNYLLFLSPASLLALAPVLFVDAALKLVVGRNRRAKIHAWASVLFGFPALVSARGSLQRSRRRSDREVLALFSRRYVDGEGLAARALNGAFAAYLRIMLGRDQQFFPNDT